MCSHDAIADRRQSTTAQTTNTAEQNNDISFRSTHGNGQRSFSCHTLRLLSNLESECDEGGVVDDAEAEEDAVM
jgi:hypothetical protein